MKEKREETETEGRDLQAEKKKLYFLITL